MSPPWSLQSGHSASVRQFGPLAFLFGDEMSLDRKDVRFKLAPDLHQALTVLAECAGCDIGEYVEMVVQRDVLKRVHDSILVASAAQRAGIAGISRESEGPAWNVPPKVHG